VSCKSISKPCVGIGRILTIGCSDSPGVLIKGHVTWTLDEAKLIPRSVSAVCIRLGTVWCIKSFWSFLEKCKNEPVKVRFDCCNKALTVTEGTATSDAVESSPFCREHLQLLCASELILHVHN
jgi:hypothetical protein